jgi:EpsI family protein
VSAGAKRRALAVGGAIVLAALAAAAFWPSLRWLVERWREPEGYYSHGPLVPLAALWIAWRERERLRATPRRGSWRGLALLLPALAIGTLAALLRFDSPAALALIALLLPGFVLLFEGGARLRRLALPLAFLLFAWPLPEIAVVGAIDVLKRIVVPSSAALVNLFGAGVAVRGSWLLLPDGGKLLIDDECSGLKSALALVALGAFMAATARGLSKRGRLLLLLLALPVALAANIVRVALLAAVGAAAGAERAGALHDPSTWGVYLVAIALYLLVEWRLRRRAEAKGAASAAAPALAPAADGGGGRARFAVAALLLCGGAAVTWRADRPRPAAQTGVVARVAMEIDGWRGEEHALTKRHYDLLETRDVLLRSYVRGGDDVLACVAVAGPDGKAAHPPEVCYRGLGYDVAEQRRIDVELGGSRRRIERLRARQGTRDLLVWSWYRVGEVETAGWLNEWWLALCARLRGRDERVALLRFSTVVRRGSETRDDAAAEAAAEARLREFVGNFLPALDAALAGAATGGESRTPPANGASGK